MNENINLCDILRGLEGIELYSSVNGEVKFCYIKPFSNYPIKCIDKYNNEVSFTIKGKYIENNIGECILFPSKDQRDWSKFERPIPINAPMMCSDTQLTWHLKYYSGFFNFKHRVHCRNYKDNFESWKYIIPYDRFDPKDIDKSLKYNIQKDDKEQD